MKKKKHLPRQKKNLPPAFLNNYVRASETCNAFSSRSIISGYGMAGQYMFNTERSSVPCPFGSTKSVFPTSWGCYLIHDSWVGLAEWIWDNLSRHSLYFYWIFANETVQWCTQFHTNIFSFNLSKVLEGSCIFHFKHRYQVMGYLVNVLQTFFTKSWQPMNKKNEIKLIHIIQHFWLFLFHWIWRHCFFFLLTQ